jgi:hypothetical protein
MENKMDPSDAGREHDTHNAVETAIALSKDSEVTWDSIGLERDGWFKPFQKTYGNLV